MEYPLVSAIVLSYNQAQFAVECLEGIRAQNYPNLEIIVNDDASRDNSVEVIQRWLDQSGLPHQFIKSPVNLGICRSMNNALAQARGKYVAGIAADDVWLPGKLLKQVEMMERLPEKVGVVYSDALQMDEAGNLLPKKFIEEHREFKSPPEGDLQKILWEGNFIPAMSTLVRTDCYRQAGLFDEKLAFEDWDMWLRIARTHEFAFSPHISAKYRKVSTSMVRARWGKLVDAMCQMCLKHLEEGELEPAVRRAAIAQLQAKAMVSYACGSPRNRHNLLDALAYGPSPKVAARCLFAWCGLGAERFESLRTLFKGTRSQTSPST